jgi:hypothetical protein
MGYLTQLRFLSMTSKLVNHLCINTILLIFQGVA